MNCHSWLFLHIVLSTNHLMEQFLSFFTFDIIGIAGLSIVLITFVIQIYFYSYYYNKPIACYKNKESNSLSQSKLPSVSVIIVAKNESENLEKNLPVILNQDYSDYEVIVVNDGSTDESDTLLKRLKRDHPHLYHTFSPVSTYQNWSQKQKHRLLSLTIGIKAATKDILLFTEADTAPCSSKWISSMISNMTSGKDIVIGYCNYKAENGFWSKIALFDNLLFSLQYFSMAIRNKPYTGVYRNVAYRRKIFFDNKGFSSTLNHDNAEDVFLNKIMTKDNTAVSLYPLSFVTCNLDNFSKWRFIKSSYIRAKKSFKNFSPTLFKWESVSRCIFYISILALIIYSVMSSLWFYLVIALLLFGIRYLTQLFTLKKSADHFETETFRFLLPLIDISQSYYNFLLSAYSSRKSKSSI